MAVTKAEAAEQREDFSRFVVHLTRDDRNTFNNGQIARKNFLSILDQRKIRAYAPHCLHKYKIEKLDAKIRKQFYVSCFTEIPLNQIRLLTQSIIDRDNHFSEYGFVFTREFLIKRGAQPAIYINRYGGNRHLEQAVNQIYDTSATGQFLKIPSRIIPYINVMCEYHDFTWEREWRFQGTLPFKLSDLVCVILPASGDGKIQQRLMRAGVVAISPHWTYDRVVAELAKQNRATRLHLKDLIGKETAVKTSKTV